MLSKLVQLIVLPLVERLAKYLGRKIVEWFEQKKQEEEDQRRADDLNNADSDDEIRDAIDRLP